MACRDAWIGWDDATRARHLVRVVNNSRLRILPWVRVRNLASTLLAQLARRVAADWRATYGVGPGVLETLIDPARFDGASYRAATGLWLGRPRDAGAPIARPGVDRAFPSASSRIRLSATVAQLRGH